VRSTQLMKRSLPTHAVLLVKRISSKEKEGMAKGK
jgi:hypothetical protein